MGSMPNPDLASSDDELKDFPCRPFKVVYNFAPVPIPENFLSTSNPPPDAQPVTLTPVDFTSVLPEYEGTYAVVLENVLSPSECAQLLRMAEASVPEADRYERRVKKPSHGGKEAATTTTTNDDSAAAPAPTVFKDPWRPACVSVGADLEVLQRDYRRGDRIVWDEQEITDRLWARCAQAPGLLEKLAVVGPDEPAAPFKSRYGANPPWRFLRINRRMRFLKYRRGDFFRPHCDGAFADSSDGKYRQTLFTLHLYLNDSKAEAAAAGRGPTDLVGGATPFLSRDGSRRIDVNPRCGRVLIFQHNKLRHSGDDVVDGVKYTMRTDLLYEMVELEKDEGK
ncbi:hypothetical protein PpBr36_08185 [Pyricularia pennisetigena]|uniref:hypothetical protein n=1 Tax=Pyricularia pennisetigena TaxID=1578925 RepID=UPI001150EDF2|nr:hypothetical protein PpBr36_08185 [Pyricularia pennisetigena]TLS24482.1 hypothetical protein PpBr36_08185 [Pyricularia pennisetigena]